MSDRQMLDTAAAVATFAYEQGVGEAVAVDDLIRKYERYQAALEFIAAGQAFGPVEVARGALGLRSDGTPKEDRA